MRLLRSVLTSPLVPIVVFTVVTILRITMYGIDNFTLTLFVIVVAIATASMVMRSD